MPRLTFHLIPHTHWDREWYLPQGTLRARLVPMLDDLLIALAADSSFRTFLLDGQTVLAEDYLAVRPEQRSAFEGLVRTGRIQVGPWYVLADEFIPSPESLIRNLLLGRTDAEALGGRLDVMYSPDAFGHPGVWPTLGCEFGIRYGALWRGVGGEPGQQGDFYRWEGTCGDVLVYHLPPDGYEIGAALPADPARLAEVWRTVRAQVVPRASTGHIPIFVGADHHAAHPAVGRLRDLLAALEPEHDVRVSRLDEALAAMEESAGSPARLQGEQRWSYRYTWTLQGVHATRAPLKRRNALLELGLERGAEPLAALAALAGRVGGRDRRPLLRHTWRTLVQCHFHDAIGGCSSDEVAAAVSARMGDVQAATHELTQSALHELTGHDPDRAREEPESCAPTLHLWNPAARARDGVTVADLSFFRSDVFVGPPGVRVPRRSPPSPAFALQDSSGRVIPVQVLARKPSLERLDAPRHYPDQDEVESVTVAFAAPVVPGFGLTSLTPVRSRRTPAPGAQSARARGRRLENRFVAATVEPGGAITLYDKITGERFSGLLALESGGDEGDTYTYCPPARERLARSRGPARVRVTAAGPLVASIEVEYHLRAGRGSGLGPDKRSGSVHLRAALELRVDSPTLMCTLAVDNQATDHRLRLRLPLGLPGVDAIAGAPFAGIVRSAVDVDAADFPRETPVSTAPAQRFVAAARGVRGLALLAPGFFEYEWTSEGDLLFTILRAVGELSKPTLRTRPGHAGWPTPTPMAQCLGISTLSLGLTPVSEGVLEAGDRVPRLWEDAFVPLRPFWLRNYRPTVTRDPSAGLSLEGEGLVLSALKPAEEQPGFVVRCYNPTDGLVPGAWRLGSPVQGAERVRADERGAAPLPLEEGGRVVRFEACPGEIVTIRMY